MLRSIEGSAFGIDANIAKNRLGPRSAFRLRFDPERASFAEANVDDPIEAALQDAAFERKQSAARRRVLDVIRDNPRLTTKNAVAAATRGRKAEVLGVLDLLMAEGVVTKSDAGFCIVEGKDSSS